LKARIVSLALLVTAGAFGATIITPAFSSDYSLVDLGSVPGLPGPYGGLVLEQGNNQTLLIGGAANGASGVVDSVGVTRDSNGHISGFGGSASQFSTAPYIDGGLAYAPNGDLFYTAYPSDQIGEIKPGSTSPDKVVNVPTGAGNPSSSVGTLNFIPSGFPNAGSMVVGSYNGNQFCILPLAADGSGTYDIGNCSTPLETVSGGPEGIVYVPAGSADFPNPSVLISEYGAGKVQAFTLDANGLPLPSSGQDFITGLTGAQGAVVDPVTGDFLFSTFGGGNHVYEIRGFAAPVTATPEPATAGLLGFALAGLCFRRFRRG